jgi:hypothetical protein
MIYVALNILLLLCSIIAVELGQPIIGMVALLAMIPVALIFQVRGIKNQRN